MKAKKEHMESALAALSHGIRKGDSPFGAAVVKNGKLVAVAHNTVLQDKDPTAHAEVNAIRKAAKKLRTHDLKGCVVYSTCEPCPMCFAAIHWANCDGVVYGAGIADAKRCGFRELSISNARMKSLGKAKLFVVSGVMRKECAQAMAEWKKLKNRKTY
jgi:tRNA(Arg) A34 adenosine deaminase TadA